MDIWKQRILQAFELTYDFYNQLGEDNLRMKISNVPSNTIGEQAYCIIGARESYVKALKAGEWVGFQCSLADAYDKGQIISKLEETYDLFQGFLQEKDEASINLHLLIDVLEHEVQHHGQLIRYAYANKIGFPKSWNDRYTV